MRDQQITTIKLNTKGLNEEDYRSALVTDGNLNPTVTTYLMRMLLKARAYMAIQGYTDTHDYTDTEHLTKDIIDAVSTFYKHAIVFDREREAPTNSKMLLDMYDLSTALANIIRAIPANQYDNEVIKLDNYSTMLLLDGLQAAAYVSNNITELQAIAEHNAHKYYPQATGYITNDCASNVVTFTGQHISNLVKECDGLIDEASKEAMKAVYNDCISIDRTEQPAI